MKIEHGKVVSFEYTLHEQQATQADAADGPELERSEVGEPVAYLHGVHGLMDALQEKFVGHESGAEIIVDVPPERAYGVKKPNSEHRIPLKHVVGASQRRKLQPGEAIRVMTPDGERDATVVKSGKFNVDIDTNHPLAGKHLRFRARIVQIREATEEEMAHGHAHGPGGHQHD